MAYFTRAERAFRTLRNAHEQAVTLAAMPGSLHAGGRAEGADRAWRAAYDLFERLSNRTEAAAVRLPLDACRA